MKRYITAKNVVISLVFLTACVSPRVVDDLEKRMSALQKAHEDCKEDLEIKEEQLARNENALAETLEEVKNLERDKSALLHDTLVMGRNYRRLKGTYADLSNSLEKQIQLNKDMATQSEQKNKELYSELIALQKELEGKEKKLNDRDKNLSKLQGDLQARERKVNELEAAIAERDSLMKGLKKNITDALLSYKGKGITVETKGDKVYVSLEEQILFASGKYTLDKKGEEALLDLAKVLNTNDDITIMVEGHTDDVPIKTSCISDNYDLSVLRGAEITRILVEKGNVDPTRIIAAGRGEYMPVADNETSDGRKKNRRIEIILTPDLDKLLNLLNE